MAVVPFPFQTLPRLAAADLAVLNAAVGWLGGVPEASLMRGVVLGVAVGGWRVLGVGRREPEPSAGLAWLVREEARALLGLPGEVVRAVTRRLLAAPLELAAPRPLTAAEHAVAAMLCASALAEWGEAEMAASGRAGSGTGSGSGRAPGSGMSSESGAVPGAGASSESGSTSGTGSWSAAGTRSGAGAGSGSRTASRTASGTGTELLSALSIEPWQPIPDARGALAAVEQRVAGWPCLELGVLLDGREHVVRAWIPPSLAHRRPVRRPRYGWLAGVTRELPVVLGAAPMEREALARLALRDVIVVAAPESGAELRLGRGAVGVRIALGAAHAVIDSGYRRAVDPLSDDVTTELTVTLGTTALSLRQLGELAVGQVVPLGRPLHGPFELRVGGKVIGSGELVDVEGALGVRVTALNP